MRKGNKEARVLRRTVGMRERGRKFRNTICALSTKVQLAPVSNVFILHNSSEDHAHAQTNLSAIL